MTELKIPRGPGPTPAEIKAARKRAKLTGVEAAALVHSNERSWRKWESGDRKIHLAFWELFLIKTNRDPYPHRPKSVRDRA